MYPPADEKQVEAALKVIPANCDEKTWAIVAKAVCVGLGEDGWPIFHAWSKTGGASYKDEPDCRKKWNSAQKSFSEIGVGKLFHLADQANPACVRSGGGTSRAMPMPMIFLRAVTAPGAEVLRGIARLAIRGAPHRDLRHVAKWGRWLQWDGTRWITDDTVFAFDLARKICREAAAQCNKPNEAKVLASAKTATAVERLAKADRRLAATTEQWDTKAYLINEGD